MHFKIAFLEIFSYSLILAKHWLIFFFHSNLCAQVSGIIITTSWKSRGGFFCTIDFLPSHDFSNDNFKLPFWNMHLSDVKFFFSTLQLRAEPKENICMAKEQIVNIRSFYGPPQCWSLQSQGAALVQIAWLFKHEPDF